MVPILRLSIIAAAVGSSAGALALKRTVQAPPPDGFVWSDGSMKGFVMPTSTNIPLPVPSAGKPGKLLGAATQRVKANAPAAAAVFTSIGRGVGVASVDYSKIAAAFLIAYSSAFSERVKANAPAAVEVFTSIGLGVGVASVEYSKIAAAFMIAYYSAFSERVKANAPAAVEVFTSIGRGVGVASVDYSKIAAAFMIAYSSAFSQRVKANAPAAADVFTSIGHGVAAASVDYAKVVAAVAVTYYKVAVDKADTLRRWPKYAALKREGAAVIARRAEVATVLALSSKLSYELIAARTERAAAEGDKVAAVKRAVVTYSKLTTAFVIAYYSAFTERVQANAPATVDVFTAIGRGVGAASIDYSNIAAAQARATYLAVSQRVKLVAAMVTKMVASLSQAMADVAALKQTGVGAAVSADAGVLAALKAEGEVTVAKRAEMAAALDAKLKLLALKAEGEAVVARRASMQVALEERMGQKPSPAPKPTAVAATPPLGFVWGLFQ